MLGRLLALVFLATTSVTKQRQISCHFSTQAKYKERTILFCALFRILKLILSRFFSGEGGWCDNFDDIDDDEGHREQNRERWFWRPNPYAWCRKLIRSSEGKNRFFQSFDIWTQSSIQSCFHTFIFSCTIILSQFQTIILS